VTLSVTLVTLSFLQASREDQVWQRIVTLVTLVTLKNDFLAGGVWLAGLTGWPARWLAGWKAWLYRFNGESEKQASQASQASRPFTRLDLRVTLRENLSVTSVTLSVTNSTFASISPLASLRWRRGE
jgi:hypothetical protein